ncbi:MAG: transporter substrate-binding domain-containing protein [Burkholderiales bacterium]|nr:transporter substrate-binding domain-containing protein [Burkholderiales bacterium]
MHRLLRLFFLTCLCWQAAAAAYALELLTEDDAPHNMLQNGKIAGSAADKLELAFRRAGVAQHMELVPWARAYRSALTQEGYCAFSTARTSAREALFKWIGPVAAMDWVLYSRADNPAPPPAKLDDVRQEIIGGYWQDVISLWLSAQGFQVDSATKDAANPKKLLTGRINYWASSRPRASAMLEKVGLSAHIKPVLTFGHTDLYLACHRTIADETVHKLNLALKRMQEDGSAAGIEARYAHWPAVKNGPV